VAGSITSDKFMVSIKPNVDVTGHPQDQMVYENDTVIFNLAVSGALPIHYQWQKNGIDISGAIYNIYPIYGVQLSDSAYYRCIVSNDCSVETTNEAWLTVLPASSIKEMNHEASFSILPNPVKSNCRISFQQKIEQGHYEIFSMSGEKIRSEEFSNTNFLDLGLSALLPGIYLIRIESTEMTGSTKFIKD
jgi:hypothetical protein